MPSALHSLFSTFPPPPPNSPVAVFCSYSDEGTALRGDAVNPLLLGIRGLYGKADYYFDMGVLVVE